MTQPDCDPVFNTGEAISLEDTYAGSSFITRTKKNNRRGFPTPCLGLDRNKGLCYNESKKDKKGANKKFRRMKLTDG